MQMQTALVEYIEGAYHITNEPLLRRRHELLETNGVISQLPYIESSARFDTGKRYDALSLPEPVRELLTLLATPTGGRVIFNPPYSHQAEALEAVLSQQQRNLIVTTGTGSGKTETFLLPILGRLAREAATDPTAFGERAVRALLLYPMNALVNDQLARLRLLFGATSTAGWFVKKAGRPAKFGRYTSRTPFPGVIPDDTARLLDRFRGLKFYFDLEQKAKNGDAKTAKIIRLLKGRGKWPVKINPQGSEFGFSTWFGSGQWFDKNKILKRAIERLADPELITRFEMQQSPPDLLVTNYSMLEYMMLRPIERSIFDVSKAFYANHPQEKLVLVLDEAHLYRGAQGTEVAMLIRRLRCRLGLTPDRLQVICTSASFGDSHKAKSFAASLSGTDESLFTVLSGSKTYSTPSANGDKPTAEVLAAIRLAKLRTGEYRDRFQAILDLLEFRRDRLKEHRYKVRISDEEKTSLPGAKIRVFGLRSDGSTHDEIVKVAIGGETVTKTGYVAVVDIESPIACEVARADGAAGLLFDREGGVSIPRDGDALSRILYDVLNDLPVVGRLLNLTSGALHPDDPETTQGGGAAQEVSQLAKRLFPNIDQELAQQATDTLIELASMAKADPSAAPLLAARVHRFFRGLPGLWACSDRSCTQLKKSEQDASPVGQLYVQPLRTCSCGARVFELHTCRTCGSAYFIAWTLTPDSPEYLWHQDVGEIDDADAEVKPVQLLLEDPTEYFDANDDSAQRFVERYLDPVTGRLSNLPGETTRPVWLPPFSVDQQPGLFPKCPCCQKQGTEIMDLKTKGDEPFQQLIASQLLEQPPRPDVDTPLRGRKALIFSDGRQPASRLAGKLGDNSLRDSVRPLLLDGYQWFREQYPDNLERVQSLRYAYAALLAGAYRNDVKLTPKIRGGEHSFYDHVSKINTLLKENADWESMADAADSISTQIPRAILLALYEVLFNKQTGVHSLALAALIPRLSDAQRNALNKLPAPPVPVHLTENERREHLLGLWVRLMADRRAILLPGTPTQWIGTSEGARLNLQQGGFSTILKPILSAAFVRDNLSSNSSGTSGPWLNYFSTQLGYAQNAGKFLLNGTFAALVGADSTQWQRCERCSWVQPLSILDSNTCQQCHSHNTVQALDMGPHSVFQKRKGLYRRLTERLASPNRGAWSPHPFVAEEHTAAIGAIDSQQSFSRAEWYEMRFQDLEVEGPAQEPGGPVDVLSCTTTMEVGIDIGSLTAVALRNVPPNRANYQQRAGRAGRRGSSLSTVITYADQGSHDQKFFSDPAAMICGPVSDPILNLDNPDIVVRHGYAFILGLFQQEKITDQWANARDRANIFASLGWVGDFRSGTSEEFSYRGLEKWINDNEDQLEQSLRDLMPNEFVESCGERLKGLPLELLQKLRDSEAGPIDETQKPEGISGDGSSDAFDDQWDDFSGSTSQSTEMPKITDISAESSDAGRDANKLLDRLFDKAVVPSYAFPTDVVSMTVFDRKLSDPYHAVIKYAPQRGLSQALSSYAPGHEVFIDGLRHYSFAIYSQMPSDRYNAWMNRHLYYECSQCGYVEVKEKDATGHFVGELVDCPACRSMKDFGPAIYWMTPPGFAHPYDMDEDLAIEDPPDLTRPTHAKLTAEFQQSESPDEQFHLEGRGFLKWARKEELFITNAGSRTAQHPGFRYCTFCGRIEPNGWAEGTLSHATHSKPYPDHRGRDGKEVCSHRGAVKTVTLGTRFRSDVALYRLQFGKEIRLTPGSMLARIALGTLANAMSATVVRHLEIERNNVGGEYRPALTAGGATGSEVDIYLYDTTSGGAGFVQSATSDAKAFLCRTLELLEDCDCTHSCYKCLHNYENRYLHADLDRKVASAVLKHVLGLETRPTLDAETEDRLLASLVRDMQDSGHKQIASGPGYLQLPEVDNRRIVLSHSLNPTVPATKRATDAISEAPQQVVIPHLMVERALPLAVNRALGVPATDPVPTDALPSFVQVLKEGGVPVYNLRQLSNGWIDVEPLFRVSVGKITKGSTFLLRLEEPLLEKFPIKKSERVVGRITPGTLLLMQRLESVPPTNAMSGHVAIVRHRNEMFRATRSPVTLGSLQWRGERIRVGYVSTRPNCKPEILSTEGLEVLAVMRGVYHAGELMLTEVEKDEGFQDGE